MYQLVFNTGIFAADFQERNKRAAAGKTLPRLKVFFSAAHREWRHLIQNEMVSPYGAVHNATANLDDGCLQQETVDAIVNLATATASDRASTVQLTAAVTVARLTTEVVMVNENIAVALQAKLAIRGIQGRRNKTTCGWGARSGAVAGVGSGTGTGSGDAAIAGASAPTMVDSKELEPTKHYCCTCGPIFSHNSAKCPSPASSCIYTATKMYIQGGVEAPQCYIRGETVINNLSS